jgi:hypothetical protein
VLFADSTTSNPHSSAGRMLESGNVEGRQLLAQNLGTLRKTSGRSCEALLETETWAAALVQLARR